MQNSTSQIQATSYLENSNLKNFDTNLNFATPSSKGVQQGTLQTPCQTGIFQQGNEYYLVSGRDIFKFKSDESFYKQLKEINTSSQYSTNPDLKNAVDFMMGLMNTPNQQDSNKKSNLEKLEEKTISS
ncbi:MAG: hypothetical protein ACKO46_06345, partial [Alphaproteobacteria bacterium]